MSKHPLDILNDWYIEQCDGDWEHSEGITLSTLDNPGWILKGSLTFDHADDELCRYERSNEDWLICSVRGNKFEGACAPGNLNELITFYVSFVRTGRK